MPVDQRDKERLERLSSLVLSRVLLRITTFKDSEETKKFGTDYCWSAVLGPVVTNGDADSGVIYTSHESLLNAPKTEILHYQNMQATFVDEKNRHVRQQCIVYC